jgi:hypothetical protein
MLLADLTAPSLAKVLHGASRPYDFCKRRCHLAVLDPIQKNGSESARTPERAPGNRVQAQPFNLPGQFFLAVVSISASSSLWLTARGRSLAIL